MTLIHINRAAKELGISYETFRRLRAMGTFRRIEFVKYGEGTREMVVLESVEMEKKLATKKGQKEEI